MKPLTHDQIIAGAAYASRGHYGHPLRFAAQVAPAEPVRSSGPVSEFLCERKTALLTAAESGPLNQEAARALLLSRDIDVVLRTIEENISTEILSEEWLQTTFDEIRGAFERDGLDVAGVKLSIADDYPGPYAGSDAWAMNYDVGDKRVFGIEPSIVLKREFLMPLYSPFIAAHELVHAVIGKQGSESLARGLEDGICDLYGSLYACSNVLGENLCATMLLTTRKSAGVDQLWKTYRDSLALAFALYKSLGWEGILSACRRSQREGRQVVKDLERDLLRGAIDGPHSVNSDGGVVDRFITSFLVTPTHLVVSPLALVLAERLEPGVGIQEFLITNEVDIKEGQAAIDELENRVFVILTADGEVAADETKPLLEAMALRYELPRAP